MNQLVLKDLFTQRLFAYLFPLFILLPIYMGNLAVSGESFVAIYVTFAAIWMTVLSNFGTTTSNRLELKLMSSLPVTRKDLVQAKYCAAFLWWGISLIIYGIIAFLAFLFINKQFSWENISILLFSLSLFLIIISFFYPLYFLFGYQIAAGIVIAFPMLGFSGLIFLSLDSPIVGPASLHLFQANNLLIYFLFILASIVITFISYLLSVKIYEEKDL